MKRIGALLCAASLLLGLTACGAPAPVREPSSEKETTSSALASAERTEQTTQTAESTAPPDSAAETTATSSRCNELRRGSLTGLTPVAALSQTGKAGYSSFALRLMQKTAKEGVNSLLSPASVYLALAMTANGADGDTRRQMLDVLGAKDLGSLNKDCRDLQSVLVGNPNGYFRLANSLWLNQEAASSIQPAFLEADREYFGADVRLEPFDAGIVEKINRWVSGNTAGRIDDLLKTLDPYTFMVIVNTLLFEGRWEEPFIPEITTDGVFHAAGGDKTLPMMHQTRFSAVWYEDGTVQATRLPFDDGRTALLLALPKGELHEWLASLTPETLGKLVAGQDTCQRLTLTLPRFRVSYKEDLKETLEAMGMPDAFSVEKADFSGMVKPDGEIMLPHIDKGEHETVLEVSEKGATAAAATAFALKAGSPRVDEIKELTLDRPFFCALVDEKTGAVLFGGAVYAPEELELEG